MKVFLISFTSLKYPMIQRKSVLDFLDTQSVIKNWYGVMPHAILVTVEDNTSTSDISKILISKFPKNFTYIVTDAHYADGMANKEVWDFINQPKPSGRWK